MSNMEQENFAQLLIDSFARWYDVYENGGSDPFHCDGIILKLIRNHILHYRRKIEETMSREDYPKEYYFPLPPEVDNNYMAKPDEIRCSARRSLKIYREDRNYIFLLSRYCYLTKDDKKNTRIGAALGYCANLEYAIATDDLVTMRRHRDPEHYLSSFSDCAAKVMKIEPERLKPYQMDFLSNLSRGSGGRGR
ncbi:MAG: hypothetical protein LBQ10_06300 [Desulfovibrio sp.]|nr:hypothetical protein [Desulfovibrio sp.]